MHLELLSEDRSGSVVLASILRILREKRQYSYTFDIRPHRGKGYKPQDPRLRPVRDTVGLLDLLPAKSRAYARVMAPDDNLLIVVMDSDEIPSEEVESGIRSTLSRYASPLPHVIGICVEEIEAWLLGDPQAILSAYPEADMAIVRQYAQDSICGTWETLARCVHPETAERVIKIGYPAIGQYKFAWCRDISVHLDPDRNVSPSFRRFLRRLETALRHLPSEGRHD